jgi:hypothetical protein
MPVLTAADFEAVLDSGIDTATIEAAIAREEAALERELGGPLEGERTDTLYPAGHDGPLTLRRFAAEVAVTSDGATLADSDIRLIADDRGRPGGAIERASGAWGDVVTVTSTPDNTETVKRYLIEAVRRSLVPDSERAIGEGRSQAGAAIDAGRALLRRYLRDLQPQVGSTSVPVRITDRVAP